MARKKVGFFLGIGLFAGILLLPPLDSFHEVARSLVTEQQAAIVPEDLTASMQAASALMVLMVVWWITEAIPLPATALLPAVILPLLHPVGVHNNVPVEFTFRNVAVNYANPVIFLFLGGFLIAAAMQKWKLDRRFSLWILSRGALAEDSRKVLFGIMFVTAFLSMWISNTATAAMMLPLGIGILSSLGYQQGSSRFGTSLMLGIAWAASIGGMGTIIGTPPNGIALGILDTSFGDDPGFRRITFLDWMKFGIPYVVLFLPIAWFVLVKLFPPESLRIEGAKKRLLEEYESLGSLSAGEKRTLGVLILAAVLWVLLPFRNVLLPASLSTSLSWLDEYSVGILAGALLFILPEDFGRFRFLLDWKDSSFVDWGVLILFGGGIALSDAIFRTGLGTWIATSFVGVFGSPPTIGMMFVVVFLVDFLTEISSNTAVTSMMVPIVISIAAKTGENPVVLALSAALAASMAYMLPVATPPNALVYATGYIRLKDMVRAGFILDILGWLFTIAVLVVFAWLIFGVVAL